MGKIYMSVWYDGVYGKLHNDRLEADSLSEAKHKAFRKYCDAEGDRLIDNLEIFEKKYEFDCAGEINPAYRTDKVKSSLRNYYIGRI